VKTVYTIPAADSMSATIDVYGDPDNAWYEWRIIDGGRAFPAHAGRFAPLRVRPG